MSHLIVARRLCQQGGLGWGLLLFACLWVGTVKAASVTKVGEWRFDENVWADVANEVKDSTGGRHGRAKNGARTIISSGSRCNYGEFDGSNDYIAGGTLASNADKEFTMMAWVRIDKTSGTQTLFSFPYSSGKEYALRIKNGNYEAFSYDDKNHGAIHPVSNSDVGQWIHLTATVKGGKKFSLYRNGVELVKEEHDHTNNSNNIYNTWSIGARPNGGEPFDGGIDEVKIFDGQMKQSDIASHMGATNTCPAPPPPSGPKAAWNFDELSWGSGADVKDALSLGVHGSAKNGAKVDFINPAKAGTPGTCGYAEFDGVDDYISLGNPSGLNFTGKISIAAWIRIDSLSHGDYHKNIVAHGRRDAPREEVVLRIQGSSYRIQSWDGTEYYAQSTIPGADIGRGKWTHLVGIYDGSHWHLYVDGVLKHTRAGGKGSVTVNKEWAIGATADGQDRFFDGGVDEVRIYDYDIDATEVQRLMSETRPCTLPPTTGTADPKLYLPFEDDPPNSTPSAFASGFNAHSASVAGTGVSIKNVAPGPALTGNPGTCSFSEFESTGAGRATIPYHADLNGDSFTVAMWIASQPSSGWRTILSNTWQDSGTRFRGYRIYLNPSNKPTFVLAKDGRTWETLQGADMPYNQFYHLAFVFERTAIESAEQVRGTMAMYVNGNLMHTKHNALYSPLTRIASEPGDKDFVINAVGSGTLVNAASYDELKVYDYALNQPQIMQLKDERHPCELPPQSPFAFRRQSCGHIAQSLWQLNREYECILECRRGECGGCVTGALWGQWQL